MWSLRWHFTNKSVTGAPYSIKSYSLSRSWTPWWRVRWVKHAVPSRGRGGTAAAMMAQNEQMTEEHSTLEQQSPGRLDRPAWCVVWTVWWLLVTTKHATTHTQRRTGRQTHLLLTSEIYCRHTCHVTNDLTLLNRRDFFHHSLHDFYRPTLTIEDFF